MCVVFVSPPAGEASSETDKAAGDGSAALGSAIGMLSSLTSVVQSTVSRNILCVFFCVPWKEEREVHLFFRCILNIQFFMSRVE